MTNIRKMLNNNYLESEVCMKRKMYESPSTLRTEVELESEFMKASVFVDKEDSEALPIENQTLGKEFDFTNGNDENGSGWD